jgi:hypothetical protein
MGDVCGTHEREETCNLYRFLLGKSEGKRSLRRFKLSGMIILERGFKKQEDCLWAGFI